MSNTYDIDEVCGCKRIREVDTNITLSETLCRMHQVIKDIMKEENVCGQELGDGFVCGSGFAYIRHHPHCPKARWADKIKIPSSLQEILFFLTHPIQWVCWWFHGLVTSHNLTTSHTPQGRIFHVGCYQCDGGLSIGGDVP